MAGAQVLGPSSSTFPSALAATRSEAEQPESVLTCYASNPGSSICLKRDKKIVFSIVFKVIFEKAVRRIGIPCTDSEKLMSLYKAILLTFSE